MRRARERDALLLLIGGWFGLLVAASLIWMMLALTSYHGAAGPSDAAVIIFGPITMSLCFGLAAFFAWLGGRTELATSAALTTMLAVVGLLFYQIGTLG